MGVTMAAFAIAFRTALAALGAFALAAAPALAKDWKTVRIGIDATYPPFESVNPQGKIVGWEVEYAEELCRRMKVTCTFQSQDWDGIIPALIAGKFDMIMSSMSITPPRQKLVDFSAPYYFIPPVFMAAASNKSDDVSPAGLKGRTIGTQSSTTFSNYLEKFHAGSEIKLYPGGDEPQIELANGRLDYTVTSLIVASTFIEKNPGCCRIVAVIPPNLEIFGPGTGAAFRKEDADLRAMFDKAVAEVDADGTFKTIADKYFKINIRGK